MKRIPIALEWDVATQRYRWAFPWLADVDALATRKWDGHCCLVAGGKLWKRHKLVAGEPAPAGWICSHGKFGWRPVEVSPAPEWDAVREIVTDAAWDNVTCELVGPGIRGNPEGCAFDYELHEHGVDQLMDCPGDPHEVVAWLKTQPIEGIVWHGMDGRMAKLTHATIGSTRPAAPEAGR